MVVWGGLVAVWDGLGWFGVFWGGLECFNGPSPVVVFIVTFIPNSPPAATVLSVCGEFAFIHMHRTVGHAS